MKPITSPQLKKIHTLLNKTGLMNYKSELCFSFSHGRTQSSRELTVIEAKEFIEYLSQKDDSVRIIRAIWHLSYRMNIIYPGGYDEKEMNAAKLDLFCRSKGVVKKAIRERKKSAVTASPN